MKVSDAVLICIERSGGEIPFTQFDKWLHELTKAGYISRDDIFKIKITEKGRARLAKIGQANEG